MAYQTIAYDGGMYTFDTANKYVDRDIELYAEPEKVSSVNIGAVSQMSATVNVGALNTDGTSYRVDATAKGSVSPTVAIEADTGHEKYRSTLTNSATGGFISKGDYTMSGRQVTISGRTSVAKAGAVLAVTGSKAQDINIGYSIVKKTDGSGYEITPTAASTMDITYGVTVETGGYIAAGDDILTETSANRKITVTPKITNPVMPKGALTISLDSVKASKPAIYDAGGSDTYKIASTPTGTKPVSGNYYISVYGKSAASTGNISRTGFTAGYLGEETQISIPSNVSVSASDNGDTYYLPVTKGSMSGVATDPGTGYTENTSAIVPAKGWLKLEAGWYPKQKISLATLIKDDSNITGGATPDDNGRYPSASMKEGTTAYDKDGRLIVGTLKPVSVSTDPGDIDMTNSASTDTTSINLLVDAPTSGNYYTMLASGHTNFSISAGYTDGEYGSQNTDPIYRYIKKATITPGTLGAVLPTQGNKATTTNSVSISGSGFSNSKNENANILQLGSDMYSIGTAIDGYSYGFSMQSPYLKVSGNVVVSEGYNPTQETKTLTTNITEGSNKVFIKDGKIDNNVTGGTSSGDINPGSQIKINKGFYAQDLWYTAKSIGSVIDTSDITGTVSTTISTGYTNAALTETAPTGKPYLTLIGNGTMNAGDIYSGTANQKEKYLLVYEGGYTLT